MEREGQTYGLTVCVSARQKHRQKQKHRQTNNYLELKVVLSLLIYHSDIQIINHDTLLSPLCPIFPTSLLLSLFFQFLALSVGDALGRPATVKCRIGVDDEDSYEGT